MKILVDMNLSPRWAPLLTEAGWDTVHWSAVGRAAATDREIMAWAAHDGRVVLTHDLDFGAILATTGALGPSVIQVRTQDVRPEALGPLLVATLQQYAGQLESAALLVIDEARARIRLLPLVRG